MLVSGTLLGRAVVLEFNVGRAHLLLLPHHHLLLFVLHVLKPLHLTAASLLFLHPGLFALALDGLALFVPQPLGLGSVVLLLLGLGQGKPFLLFQLGLLFPSSGSFLSSEMLLGQELLLPLQLFLPGLFFLLVFQHPLFLHFYNISRSIFL